MIVQVTELLNWAKKAKPLAKVGAALASIALKFCTGLTIPTANFEATLGTKAGGALSKFVEETLTSGVEAVASVAGEKLDGGMPAERLHHAGAHRPGNDKVKYFFVLPVCCVGDCRQSSGYRILSWWSPSATVFILSILCLIMGKC